tara:strand:+ start:1 stop:1611 length:1611 start_codon:yes stop_codon:yes gene_type:complete
MEKIGMKNRKIIIMLGMVLSSFLIAEEYTELQKTQLGEEAMLKMLQKIYSESMAAKRAFLASKNREEAFSNFATTAPRSEFVVNADISSELQDGAESATVYVSTDNQATWQSAIANPIGTDGYENTWGGTINTGSGNSAFAYLSGTVNSSALGYDYGTILVSGSPHNINGSWPPSSSLYAPMVDEPSGDASSGQDIIGLLGTYQGTDAIDSEGNDYTDIERIYMNLELNSGCCDEGSFFGPWYLYGIGIVNPEAEEAIAYAIGYGDGGFGQLTPGLLKITGDLATGDIGGFDYITTNITYSTNGNSLQATALMDYITGDSQWGTWPNSFNGFIVLGVTVEASLDGLDVAAEVKDQTNPGLMVCTTTFQEGNIPLVLSNPQFDSETNTLSVAYSDGDGNLPWFKSAQICDSGTDNCFYSVDMIPDSHTYEEGVLFSASIDVADIADGDYDAKFWFADDDVENYPSPQLTIPVTIGSGGGCALDGDLNSDSVVNVLDVVLLVNLVLAPGSNAEGCSDINGDGILNVLDVVLLVNIVLG